MIVIKPSGPFSAPLVQNAPNKAAKVRRMNLTKRRQYASILIRVRTTG